MVSAKGENEVVPAPEIEPTQIVDVTGAGDVLAGSVAGYQRELWGPPRLPR